MGFEIAIVAHEPTAPLFPVYVFKEYVAVNLKTTHIVDILRFVALNFGVDISNTLAMTAILRKSIILRYFCSLLFYKEVQYLI